MAQGEGHWDEPGRWAGRAGLMLHGGGAGCVATWGSPPAEGGLAGVASRWSGPARWKAWPVKGHDRVHVAVLGGP